MAPIFSKPKVPSMPSQSKDEERIQAAAAAEQDRLRKRKGWASTWLTGPENMMGGQTDGLRVKFGE